jgi:maltose O-acetyltransferase
MNKQRSEKEKMIAGDPYMPNEPQLISDRKKAKVLCHRYNQEVETLNKEILSELFGYPTDAYLEPPFYCDYGYNMKFGANCYANHNLVVLDCAPVTFGDNVMIGPNVVISTAGHPLDAETRITGLEFAKPICIGNNVWIGATVTIVPGVEIGDNVTIGAGSVVTRSIPANSVAVGNPCRVIRSLVLEQS